MGMYDSFYFAIGVLPDNREPPTCEFQSKDLDCTLDSYVVEGEKNLRVAPVCPEWTGKEETEASILSAEVRAFSLNFEHSLQRTQEYKLVFQGGD